MKKTTMAVCVLAAVCVATTLLANLDNQKAFVAKYPDAKASLGKCSTCHVKPLPKKEEHELNPYGKDLLAKAAVDPKAAKKEFKFEKVEGLDSDGDGVKNVDEIKAGTNPGDPKSK
ncbi:MAG: thrombospondin type 3 repeat-containing protein [Thermoanaerobaculia bacterium]|nr:thrombospondin type 3 repeat-containing protein [Thermoanaerobaculia bacterium]